MTLSRRSFLQRSAASAAVLTASVPAARAANAELDVAIVGGGVSGVYAGWRLVNAPAWKGRHIEVFELSSRIGGRLFSPTFTGMPHVPAELGGMRFVITHDASTVTEWLVEHLALPSFEAPVGDARNLYYLRGKRFRESQIGDPTIIPYHLPDALVGKSPADILLAAIERVVPDARQLSFTQWQAMKPDGKYLGRPWTAWSLQELLIQPIGSGSDLIATGEAYDFFRDAIGYSSMVTPSNLADAMGWLTLDFTGVKGYRTIRGGMQRLPLTLAERFEQQGGKITRNRRLKRIDLTDQGTFLLTFASADHGDTVRVTAERVVLALPPRAISLLDPDSVIFKAPSFGSDMQAVTGHPMTKLFLGFARPWWRDAPLGIHAGRSVTDLPLRQTYYFGTEGEQPGGDRGDRRSLMMASYDDEAAHEYWDSFPKGEPVGGGPFWRMNETTIEEVRRQLSVLHGVPVPPPYDPRASMMANWGADPFGGAYHTWNVGARSWEVMPRIRKPLPQPLFVCGEAWSNDQGWINGALQTTERMLADHFSLDRPDWLPASAPLGV